MVRFFGLGLFLFILWLLLSGHFEPFLLGLGLLSCLLVVILAVRMDLMEHDDESFRALPKLPLYVMWLLWEILKANFTVAKLILSPRPAISPTVLNVTANQVSDLGRVIYANSITLTPGTVSMSVDDNQIEVHALTNEIAEDLQAGEMDRRVTWVEGAR
ncbi:MAG: Na+/H+ antiporter subunit E [Nitrospiraceae bacterium]